MTTLPVAEASTHLLSLLKKVDSGNEIAISYGRETESIAVMVPYKLWKKSKKRKLGTLEGRASVEFADNFSITDEELFTL